MFNYYFSILPELVAYVAIAAVLLSVLQVFLCRKDADRGIHLPILGGCACAVAFLRPMMYGILAFGSSWVETLPVSLLMLFIFAIPTAVFFLIYRAAKKREAQDYLDHMRNQ